MKSLLVKTVLTFELASVIAVVLAVGVTHLIRKMDQSIARFFDGLMKGSDTVTTEITRTI